MAIDITFSVVDNLISINTVHTNHTEVQIIEQFLFKVISEALNLDAISLITKDPKEYSFAQGLGKSLEMKIKDKKVLINGNFECDKCQLESIIQSEEFRRGLLLLAGSSVEDLIPRIEKVLEASSNASIEASSVPKLIFCGDDGDSVYFYNTNLNVEYLRYLIGASIDKKDMEQ